MLKRIILAGIATAVFATAAQAGSCPLRMTKIDAALPAKMAGLSAGDLTKVKSLRAKGEAKHKAGDHASSVKSLASAMKLLGIS